MEMKYDFILRTAINYLIDAVKYDDKSLEAILYILQYLEDDFTDDEFDAMINKIAKCRNYITNEMTILEE